MPQFEYQARQSSGALITGTKQAASKSALASQLASNGLLLVDAIEQQKSALAVFARKRTKPAALLGFLREFRHLIHAGMPIATSLKVLTDRPGDPHLSEAIAELHKGVEEGLPLDEAAALRPDVFDNLFQSAFRAGVRTSQLDEVLARLEKFLDMQNELRRKMRKASSYPIFLLCLLVVVLAALMLFVLPRFADLYSEFGSELPRATQILLTGVNWAPVWIPATVICSLAARFVWQRLMTSDGFKRAVDRFLTNAPVIGPIQQDTNLVQSSFMMAMLLRAGTPAHEAMGFVAQISPNTVFRDRVTSAASEISAGKSFAESVDAVSLYPHISQSMIRAGDASGDLAGILDAVGEMHERSLEDRIARLLALIEPAMMLLVGIVLGAVIITVYLPIFGISGVVQ